MKILDYSPHHSYETTSNTGPKARTLEVAAAALVFILPALVLFILSL